MKFRLFSLLLIILLTTEGETAFAGQASKSLSLKGQFLIAAPTIKDPGFAKTVILMLEHDEYGALGLIVNRAMGSGPLDVFLQGFGIETANGTEAKKQKTLRLHYGGPVESAALFVIHSRDVTIATSQNVLKDVAVTSNPELLNILANGEGPRRYLMVVGYSGWGAGQLESEIEREDWVSAPADAEIIFANDPETVWDEVIKGAELKL